MRQTTTKTRMPNAWARWAPASPGLLVGIGNSSMEKSRGGQRLLADRHRIARSKHKGGAWVSTDEAIANAISWS